MPSQKTLSTLVCLAAFGCAGGYHAPESIEAKMARYESQKIPSNIVPELPIAPVAFAEMALSSRAPASFDGGSSWDRKEKEDIQGSTKRLYFLTLLSQYYSLKGLTGSNSAPSISICPSFHTSVVEYEEQGGNHGTMASYNYSDKHISSDLGLYPEYSLPLTADSNTPTVATAFQNKDLKQRFGDEKQILKTAFDIHLAKTYRELAELCENGASDNYYAFENLSTHIKQNQKIFAPSSNGMKVLFKTTLFSNKALIESLKGSGTANRAPASATEQGYEDMIIERLGVNWTHQYFAEFNKKRSSNR
jgi:hypothetical protein